MNERSIVLVQESYQKLIPISERAASIFFSRLLDCDPDIYSTFARTVGSDAKHVISLLGAIVKKLRDRRKLLFALDEFRRPNNNGHLIDARHGAVEVALVWTLRRSLVRTSPSKSGWRGSKQSPRSPDWRSRRRRSATCVGSKGGHCIRSLSRVLRGSPEFNARGSVLRAGFRITMTKNIQNRAAAGALPLFYKDPVLLRFEEHSDVGLAPASDFSFAREAIAIPLSNSEFVVAMRHYPIVFALDEQASPIALVAIMRDHNLFIERDGSWKAGSYVPAYVRRYPFIVMETEDGAQQLLTVDRGSDRFVASAAERTGAQRLFDEGGEPTTTAQSAMAFCHAFHTDYTQTVTFGHALKAAKVLEPYHAEFRLPDGSQHQVNGFFVVNEKAFRALPEKTVAEWHTKGWLSLVTLHLASARMNERRSHHEQQDPLSQLFLPRGTGYRRCRDHVACFGRGDFHAQPGRINCKP
jgi:SapC